MKSVRLSQKDQTLLDILQSKPGISLDQLAKRTGTSVRNVRRRLSPLLKAGVVKVIRLVDRQFGRFPNRYMISMDLASSELRSAEFGYSDEQSFCQFLVNGLMKRHEFASLMARVRLESASSVLGGHCDLVAIVAASGTEAIGDFVTRVLRLLPGVRNTNTASLFNYADAE